MKMGKFINKFNYCKELKDYPLLFRYFTDHINCGNYYTVAQSQFKRLVKCVLKYSLNFFHMQHEFQRAVIPLQHWLAWHCIGIKLKVRIFCQCVLGLPVCIHAPLTFKHSARCAKRLLMYFFDRHNNGYFPITPL